MSIVLDILISVPVLLTTLLGVRDGLVRKLVVIFTMIVGLVVGQLFSQDTGGFLVDEFDVDPLVAPTWGVLLIFFSLVLLQTLIYKVVANNYKIGGVADRIVGGALGFGQGVLLVSVVLAMMARHGSPGTALTKESRFYRSVVNLAPMILDIAGETAPEAIEQLQKMSLPDIQKMGKEEIRPSEKKPTEEGKPPDQKKQ